MKLAVMQPYLFPYIGYFQLLHAVDKFVVYDSVNMINKGWINRNHILVNGEKSLFTVPLQNTSQNKLIKDVEVLTKSKWREKFLRTIEFSYRKAEFFHETFEVVEKVIQSKETLISKINEYSLRLIAEKLDLDVDIVGSSEIYGNSQLRGQDRILDICAAENATNYINPGGGVELYESSLFAEKNIKLQFLKTIPISYRQFGNNFVPNLSVIDVLMFNGFHGTREFLPQYVLE